MQDSKSGSSARGAAEPKPSPYLTRDQIERSPSRAFFLKKANGDVELAREKERTARTTTCAFMQESGIKLLLPQLSIATAIVFFHRFYARMSYETYDRVTVATTCLFLASKVEESPKKLKDVVIETYKAHHKVDKAPDVESKEFFDLKEKVLVCERILLQVLGFDLSVEHAYRPLLAYVKSIKGSKDLAQIAWNFINDSLRTTICLQYPPRCLAAAAVHLASKYLATHVQKDFKLPANPQHGGKWFLSFETTEETIQDISEQILELYMSGNQPVVGPNGGPGILSAASLSLMTDNMVQAREKAAVAAVAAVHSEPPACAEAPTPAPCAGAPPPAEQGVEGVNVEAKPSANSTSPSRRGPQESAVGAQASDRKRVPEREGARVEGEAENMPDAKRSRSSDP